MVQGFEGRNLPVWPSYFHRELNFILRVVAHLVTTPVITAIYNSIRVQNVLFTNRSPSFSPASNLNPIAVQPHHTRWRAEMSTYLRPSSSATNMMTVFVQINLRRYFSKIQGPSSIVGADWSWVEPHVSILIEQRNDRWQKRIEWKGDITLYRNLAQVNMTPIPGFFSLPIILSLMQRATPILI